ncbi:hypothetical protein ANCCEY_12675 [Ancylostoma ceylanicum]|uniref:Protein BCCIP homolog n=1 Tax=Ancylostoma ceylanicum TaxID=53326 RepID=A0A0D6L8Q3_9BILA|nr:hypothetical protein ANCCEY_12675 [Ancylostoma ceylanicum]
MVDSRGSSRTKKHSLLDKKKKKLKRKLVTEEGGSVASSSPTIHDKFLHPLKKKNKLKKLKNKHLAVKIAENNDGSSHNDSDASGEPSEETDGSSGDGDTSDLFGDGSGQQLDFDIEAFPMEADDRDGIVNMLTQVFLRADIDLPGLADAVIAQSPFGIVIGPAEDQSDEDSENVVYGILTIARLRSAKGEPSKYAKDIMDFLVKKSQKFALPDFRNAFEALKTKRPITSCYQNSIKESSTFINCVLLTQSQGQQPPRTVTVSPPRKEKMGKAQKKKLAQKALLSAEVIYDDVEDEALVQLEEGEAHYFDYPVHTEIESSSKFHTLVKDGKSFRPYRRVVIMDDKRFKAFLEHVSTSF